MQEWLTTRQIAHRANVTIDVVRMWLRERILRGYRPGGGQWKITPEDWEEFKRKSLVGPHQPPRKGVDE